MATRWEYCILTRMSTALDIKWYANRIFRYHSALEAEETTSKYFQAINAKVDALFDTAEYPLLPAILNLLGAEGWELIDDMNTGIAGGEGLVLKRPVVARPVARAKAAPAKRPAARTGRRR